MIKGSAWVIALTATALLVSTGTDAQTTRRLQLFGTRVALDCHVMELKVIVVTNLTQTPIAAGTTINFDATRYDNGDHYSGSFKSPALPFGASTYHGTDPSSSCTAWYNKTPFTNPQNQLLVQ